VKAPPSFTSLSGFETRSVPFDFAMSYLIELPVPPPPLLRTKSAYSRRDRKGRFVPACSPETCTVHSGHVVAYRELLAANIRLREALDRASSRRASLTEIGLSTSFGYFVALATQAVVFPLFGLEPPASAHAAIGLIFTAVSLARGYLFRRLWVWLSKRGLHV
jgi:hypothetical protein